MTDRQAVVEAVRQAVIKALGLPKSKHSHPWAATANAAVDAILADHFIVSRDEVEITQGHDAVSDWPAGLFPLPQEDSDE